MIGNASIGIPNLINKTMASGADTTVVIIPFRGRHAFSLVERYNSDAVHTLVATLNLEISDNYEHPFSGDSALVTAAAARAGWDPITDPSILAWLTTDQAASPPGGKPNGTSGSGSLQIDPLRCGALRYTVTWVSGTGLYEAHVAME